MIKGIGAGVLFGLALAVFIPPYRAVAEEKKPITQAYKNWASQVEKKRRAAAKAAAADEPDPPSKPAPTAASPEPPRPVISQDGSIRLNGKVLRSRLHPTPTPPPDSQPAAPQIAGATTADASAQAGLTSATPTLVPTITSTFTQVLVKIKKPKIVGGKIQMVEVEVTPTPALAEVASSTVTASTSDAAGAVTSGTKTAANAIEAATKEAAIVRPATGLMVDIRDKLMATAALGAKPAQFTQKQIARLREELMTVTTKKKDLLKGVIEAPQVTQLQVKIQRLSSSSKGGAIDSATAKLLLRVLWPEQTKQEDRLAAAAKARAASAEHQAQANASQDDLFIVEDSNDASQGPEIYIDPDTGAYVYEDGSPVYAPQSNPNPGAAPQNNRPPTPPPPAAYPYPGPPPPPPPPPENSGYVSGEGGSTENYEDVTGDETQYQEDPSLQEEPEDNSGDIIEEDESQNQEPDNEGLPEGFQEENYNEMPDNSQEPNYDDLGGQY
jgi:hypothetical protein